MSAICDAHTSPDSPLPPTLLPLRSGAQIASNLVLFYLATVYGTMVAVTSRWGWPRVSRIQALSSIQV
jgi:hypothetical protein